MKTNSDKNTPSGNEQNNDNRNRESTEKDRVKNTDNAEQDEDALRKDSTITQKHITSPTANRDDMREEGGEGINEIPGVDDTYRTENIAGHMEVLSTTNTVASDPEGRSPQEAEDDLTGLSPWNPARKKAFAGEAEAEDLKQLFQEQLNDMMSAEKQLIGALPKMADAATSQVLINAFEDHLEVTENHVVRLEQVYRLAGLQPQPEMCEAMQGLVREGEEAIERTRDGSLIRDVALIVAAQKVEHYEIAAYGCLRAIANVLGLHEAAGLLQETLDEEGQADKTLTEIAKDINMEAYKESEPGKRRTRTSL